MAEAHTVTERSLRNWKNLDPAQQVAAQGRPRTPEKLLEAARDLVRSELNRKGWDSGEGTVFRALGDQIPLARVRRVLKEHKAERRSRQRRHRAAARVSTLVQVDADMPHWRTLWGDRSCFAKPLAQSGKP